MLCTTLYRKPMKPNQSQWRIQDSSDRGAQDTAGGMGGAVSPPAGFGAAPRKILKFKCFQTVKSPISTPSEGDKNVLQAIVRLQNVPCYTCTLHLKIIMVLWDAEVDRDLVDPEKICMIEICMIMRYLWLKYVWLKYVIEMIEICMIEICVIEICMIMRYVWLRNVQSLETGSTRSMRLECLVANLSMTLPWSRGMPLCTNNSIRAFKRSSRIVLRRSDFT